MSAKIKVCLHCKKPTVFIKHYEGGEARWICTGRPSSEKAQIVGQGNKLENEFRR
jgi:hypothetical protein